MCRLMTTQLAEALEGYPLYSQDGKGKEAVCRAVFALGSVRWFILEGNREDDDVILFGIVIGLMEDEYGYISLNELSDVELDLSAQGLGKLQVRTDSFGIHIFSQSGSAETDSGQQASGIS